MASLVSLLVGSVALTAWCRLPSAPPHPHLRVRYGAPGYPWGWDSAEGCGVAGWHNAEGYVTGCLWHPGDGGVTDGAVSAEVRGDG